MLSEELQRAKRGEITFDQMVRRTRSDWTAMGSKLMMHRGQLPASVLVEDVVQEMLVAAWDAFQKFDAHKGPALTTHVLWRAHTAAKRWLDGQRGLRTGVKGNGIRHSACFVTVSDADEFLSMSGLYMGNGVDTKSVVDRLASNAHIEETLDLMGLARADHERQVMAQLMQDIHPSEIARLVFGEDSDTEMQIERVRKTAMVCLSRRCA